MDQSFNNNDVNNLNTQNNEMDNNQPLNNNGYTQPRQVNPGVAQQPAEQMNTQFNQNPQPQEEISQNNKQVFSNNFASFEETPQNNNINYSENVVQAEPVTNNNTVKPNKRKLGLIIGIISVIVIAVVGLLIFKLNSGEGDFSLKLNSSKPQTYLNKSQKTNNKIGFLMKYGDDEIFIGLSLPGVSENLQGSDFNFYNNKATFTEAHKGRIALKYGDIYYNYDTESDYYEKDNKNNIETLEERKIVYNKDNYYVKYLEYSNDYELVYKYNEMYTTSHADRETASWGLISIGYFNNLEEAKAKIDKLSKELYVCSFSSQDTLDKCNYKDYRFISDIVLEMLNEYYLFVDSYNQISIKSHRVNVVDDNVEYSISFKSGNYNNFEGYTNFKVNNIDFYTKNTAVVYNINENIMASIYVSLPYGVEKTEENVISAFTKTFSKSNEKS